MAPSIRYDPQDRTYTVSHYGRIVGVTDTWDAAHDLKESVMENEAEVIEDQDGRGR